MGDASAFLDPARQHELYGTADRLATRTGALRAARVAGDPAEQVLADLAATVTPPGAVVLDVGCGRGTTTAALARRLQPRRLIAIDLSAALLTAARDRIHPQPVLPVCADYHRLPLPTRTADLAVAAFCLYHSPRPADAIAELARCLRPGGAALLATKSADSYRELDQLAAAAGLDPAATRRPSLYASCHSGNIANLAARALDVTDVIDHAHRFRFRDFAAAAAYLATTPKYRLPARLADDPAALTAALAARLHDACVTITSTVTYVLARRPQDRP